jgi:hypothetical protein
MPLNIPDLDDRTFKDLVEEALALLPHYAPEWTNHNASDPGITLIELLAYFTEALIYRLNRITRATRISFLQLLTGTATEWAKGRDELQADQLNTALRQAVSGLFEPQRAVTASDYEEIVKAYTDRHTVAELQNIRVRCFEQTNLENPDPLRRSENAPGHASIVVVPGRQMTKDALAGILNDIRRMLEPKCLLTTRLHVVAPCRLWFNLKAEIFPLPHVAFEKVKARTIAVLQNYFDPIADAGPDSAGWPFGRAIFINDIIALLDRVPGVDYVHAVHLLNLAIDPAKLSDDRTAIGIQIGVRATVGRDTRLGMAETADHQRLVRDGNGRLIAVNLRPFELAGLAEPQVVMVPASDKE